MFDSSGRGLTSDERRRQREEAIDAFVQRFAAGPHSDLLAQMMITICRLSADGCERGDIKILNRALKELRYAFKIFRPYSLIPKVTIFGSARTPSTHPQYQEAMKFGDLMQQAGWMVITGAGDGIMRAGHHGATREASFGVAISLPFEQRTNTIIENDPKLVSFKYFFTRKLMFIKEAEAVVLFPGGFGTQDEGFEALTLVQTLKTTPIPIVMCNEPGGSYWPHWHRYVREELLGNRMIDEADLNLFKLTDRAEDAVAEILRFYRRYHSSRTVDDHLVIRMNRPVSPELLATLNQDFFDILLSGRIEQVMSSLPEEEGELADKARLVFAFDRRSAGRLRLLINELNDAP